jgi:hypothetical protein
VRLECLPDAVTGRPLIRLFDFSPAAAGGLAEAIARLAAGCVECVSVHTLPGVEALGGCRLVLRREGWDHSVTRVGPAAFECAFTPETWDNVAGLVEPFAAGAGGHQWLAGIPGEADLLLSPSGMW